jgi:archaellum biogenesis protein FlaJ (TadC family)
MGLTSVMQAVVAGIMVFVLSIINNFALMMDTLMPADPDAMQGQQMQFAMAQFNPGDLAFLQLITIVMVILLALVGAFAIIAADGGYRLKVCFFLAVTMFISGISFVLVPPLVAGILKM